MEEWSWGDKIVKQKSVQKLKMVKKALNKFNKGFVRCENNIKEIASWDWYKINLHFLYVCW